MTKGSAAGGSTDPGSSGGSGCSEEYVMQRSRQMKQQWLNDRHNRKRNYLTKTNFFHSKMNEKSCRREL